LAALRAQSLLNESPGAGYIERRWPEPFKETGAWPLSSLRQAFLTGAMERLVDVDLYLKAKVPEFVSRGDFGLASGQQPSGSYTRVWFNEGLPVDEVVFEDGGDLREDVEPGSRVRGAVRSAVAGCGRRRRRVSGLGDHAPEESE
ncbi:MAG: hypothetical protein WEA81_05360, partial [Dehalococcoidia bacterium]